MTENPIYGTGRIANHLGVSKATVRRWRKTPEGQFLEVGSMSNAGGGLGKALFSYPSSLNHLNHLMEAKTSRARKRAADTRWRATDVASGTSARVAVLKKHESKKQCPAETRTLLSGRPPNAETTKPELGQSHGPELTAIGLTQPQSIGA